MHNLGYSKLELTRLCHKVEIEYIGLNGGIMDMFTIIHGEKNKVIKLDCRDASFKIFPFEMTDFKIVLVNTGVKHNFNEGLANEFN